MENISNFCEKITPDVAGVIWLSSSDLQRGIEYFEEVNYLLDGLLIKDFKTTNETINSRFFLSKQYGNPFFVIYAKEDEYNQKTIEKNLEFAFKLNDTKRDILIIDNNNKMRSDLAQIQKKFKSNNFSYLN